MGRHSLEKQSFFRRKGTRIALGTTAYLAVFAGAGLLMTRHNDQKFNDIAASAVSLAEQRNTCTIKSLNVATALGRPAIALTIDVTSKRMPFYLDGVYDSPGMVVTFADDTENNAGGIRVVNKTHMDETYSTVLGNNPGNGPGTGANGMTVQGSILSPHTAEYEVYRENAISYEITGPLVKDRRGTMAGLVLCGTFTYEPGPPPKMVA